MWTIEQLDKLPIKHGNHKAPNGAVDACDACAMEAAYLRWAIRQGWPQKRIVEGWTDSLDCVDPFIGGFVRRWNDMIQDDAVRTRIFTPDLLDRLPGTKIDDALMLRRIWLAIDWDIRTRTPAFLRLAKLESCATALEALAPIDSQEKLANARADCEEARAAAGDAARAAERDAAWAAAGDAAWDAARDAAWAAAWDAARAAAGDAARAAARAAAGDAAGDAARAAAWDAAWAAAGDAAWDAARDAAWAAAWDAARAAAGDAARAAARAAAGDAAGDAARAAAWDAAGDAAGSRLAPTVEAVQASARQLIVRMCDLK